jgi:hypothetical protein
MDTQAASAVEQVPAPGSKVAAAAGRKQQTAAVAAAQPHAQVLTPQANTAMYKLLQTMSSSLPLLQCCCSLLQEDHEMIRIPLRAFQVPTFPTTLEHVVIMIIFFFIKMMKKMLILLQLAALLRLEQLVELCTEIPSTKKLEQQQQQQQKAQQQQCNMYNLELFATLETMKAATIAYITNAAITKASSCCTNNNKNKKAPELGTCNTMIQTSTKTRHFGENNKKKKEKNKMSQNYNNSSSRNNNNNNNSCCC